MARVCVGRPASSSTRFARSGPASSSATVSACGSTPAPSVEESRCFSPRAASASGAKVTTRGSMPAAASVSRCSRSADFFTMPTSTSVFPAPCESTAKSQTTSWMSKGMALSTSAGSTCSMRFESTKGSVTRWLATIAPGKATAMRSSLPSGGSRPSCASAPLSRSTGEPSAEMGAVRTSWMAKPRKLLWAVATLSPSCAQSSPTIRCITLPSSRAACPRRRRSAPPR